MVVLLGTLLVCPLTVGFERLDIRLLSSTACRQEKLQSLLCSMMRLKKLARLLLGLFSP